MQTTFAGTRPNSAVRSPIKQTITLLAAATSQPYQIFLPTSNVDAMVNAQDM